MEETIELELILSFIGIPFFILGLIINYRNQWLLKNGIVTTGTVVDFVRGSIHSSSSFERAYYPVVVFKTKNGQDVKEKMSFGSSPSPYAKGDKVDVLYSPDNTSRCMISSDKRVLWVPKIFIIIGCALVLVSMAIYFDIF